MIHKTVLKTKKQNPFSSQAQGESISSSGNQSEKSFLNETAFTQVIMNVQDYAIFLIDNQGFVKSWNKGAEIMKGYQQSEVIGKSHRIFYPTELKDSHLPEALLEQAMTNGKASHEGWCIRKNGTRFWADINITAIHNPEENVTVFLELTRDLTNKKVAEDNFSNYAEELRQKNIELLQSENRYHRMIGEVQDYAIILLDKDGKILDWNVGAEKLKGYKPEEIIGKSFRLFYPKESKDINLPEQLLNIAVQKGSAVHEGWRIKKNGDRFWGSVAITALHDDEGNVVGFSKVTRDLTEKKIAEDVLSNYTEDLRQKVEALRRSEERYHQMIAEIQDYAIILLNTKGEIQNWNAGAEYIKGYKGEEIIGKHFSVFYTPEDIRINLPHRLMNEARTTGKAVQEGWRVRKDGTRFWASIVITALHDANKNVIGFSKVTRDLTARKNAEDALKASAAQLELQNKTLERLNEEISSFTYVASHDLKEPLRKIQIFASRIEELPEIPEKGKDYLHKVRQSAFRMQNLIEALLSYSQISNDSNETESVDLNEVLNTVLTDLEIPVSEKEARIEVSTLPKIRGVSFQLYQLFLNLLTNALKFSKPGVQPLINISSRLIKGPDLPGELATDNNHYHMITVTDNGIGFEQEYAGKIFGAFQRLHTKNTFSGTGIGLAIVKKVIENHNGIVVAEGQPNVGASFYLYLPVTNQ
jgi:PAS domain S-box-containing protein